MQCAPRKHLQTAEISISFYIRLFRSFKDSKMLMCRFITDSVQVRQYFHVFFSEYINLSFQWIQFDLIQLLYACLYTLSW